MPTTFQLVETTFPNGEGKDTQEQINGVYDYLFVLLEQLRYTLFNLDESNINANALSEFIQNITEPIYAKISDTDDNLNELSVTAKGLAGRISNAEGNITTLTATASGLQTQVSGKIDAAQAQSIFDQCAEGFTLAATSGESGTVFKLNYNGAQIASTGSVDLCVDAVNVYGTLTATEIEGDEITVRNDAGRRCGYIKTDYASSSDYKMVLESKAIEVSATSGDLFLSGQNEASWLDFGYQYITCRGEFTPSSDDRYSLGEPSYSWSDVYCATGEFNGSDRNIKNSIEVLPEKYVRMFELVEPKRYKLNKGTSGRYHAGFIAQEVEEAMQKCGISSQEFAGWAAAKRKDGSETYFLRYSEFIPILWAKVREQEERLKRLEESA